jgi:hypothetical protein
VQCILKHLGDAGALTAANTPAAASKHNARRAG